MMRDYSPGMRFIRSLGVSLFFYAVSEGSSGTHRADDEVFQAQRMLR
jgi:hypothetical protein